MNETPLVKISIYAEERIKGGFRKTRYTALQSIDKAYIAAESYDSPEDAVALLAIAAAKRGGFLKYEF